MDPIQKAPEKTKNEKSSPTAAPLAILIFITIISCAVYTAVLLFSYEPRTGLFISSGLSTAFTIILVLSVILVGAAMLILKDSRGPASMPRPSAGVIFSSALCGFALVGRTLMTAFYPTTYPASENSKNVIALAAAISSVLAAAYFIYIAISPEPYGKVAQTLGFFPIICSLTHVLQIYFLRDKLLNSDTDSIRYIAFIFCMLYFLMELRYVIGRAKPKLYFAAAFTSFLLAATASLPTVISEFASGTSDWNELTPCFVLLFFAIYIFFRLASFYMPEKSREASDENA